MDREIAVIFAPQIQRMMGMEMESVGSWTTAQRSPTPSRRTRMRMAWVISAMPTLKIPKMIRMGMRSPEGMTTALSCLTQSNRIQTKMDAETSAIFARLILLMISIEINAALIWTIAPSKPTLISSIEIEMVWVISVIPVKQIPSMIRMGMGSVEI